MEKKQSSIEWLLSQFEEYGYDGIVLENVVEKAKQMHKEEVIDAYVECWMNDGGNGFHKVKEAEEYYNETFGGGDE